MAIQPRNTLKNWFLAGKKPLASQFADWIDSFWHKEEDSIPITAIDQLQTTLNDLATVEAVAAIINSAVQNLDTTVSPIAVNCNNVNITIFKGSNSIGAAKAWNFTNIAGLRESTIRVSFSAVAVQTFAGAKSSDGGWDSSADQWTPYAAGDYEIIVTYDGHDIYLKFFGPFN